MVFLLTATLALAAFSFIQFINIRSLRSELTSLEEKFEQLIIDNELLQEQFEEIQIENERLLEENLMLRSSTVINHGNRNTNRVAITIDDGAGAALISQALDYFQQHDVKATLFPMGSWVTREPEVWRRAVEEGHELGNHTYSHAFLTTISEERIKEELNRWQEVIDGTLGYPYRTLFFRPPGMDGFVDINSDRTKRYKEIIAQKGMFAVLWDVELIYSLRNEPTPTPARIAEHVLANARGGSIILLHFTPNDIAALPAILTGLRSLGLEPGSLRELLLAGHQV